MRKFSSLLFSSALLAASLTALSSTSAVAETTLVTCTDLVTPKTVILRVNQKSCKPLDAPAIWHIQQSDSSARSGAGYANLRTCTSKRAEFSYQLLKSKCAKYQNTNDYWRTVAPPEIPTITTASARGYDSAAFALTATTQNIDAPIAYYLITNIKTGQINKVLPNNSGELSLTNLSPLTSYTFTIAAVSVDGTSPSSSITPVITTGAVPVVKVAPTTAPIAAPAFTLSSSSETRTVNTVATGFTINSTGGAIASFGISATPAGMSFNTSTGALTGTPTSVAGATAYTITATNTSGNATQTFTFTVTALIPATKVAITRASVGTARQSAFTTQPQITIQDSSGNTVTSSTALVTATVSSGGTLVGTATANASSGVATFTGLGVDGTIGTVYTITYTAVGLSTATATVTLTGTTCDGNSFTCQVGDTGPGGGIIFYVATNTFTQSGATGSMCSTNCKYLEAAPTTGTNAWTDAQYAWSGNTTVAIGTTGTAIGSGYANTLAIIGQSATADKAGTIARAYGGPNSLTDWFLPSKDELNQMCKWARGITGVDLTTVTTPCSGGTINTGSGAAGFVGSSYWSSTEYVTNFAWAQYFYDGNQLGPNKSLTLYVRPVRAF